MLTVEIKLAISQQVSFKLSNSFRDNLFYLIRYVSLICNTFELITTCIKLIKSVALLNHLFIIYVFKLNSFKV